MFGFNDLHDNKGNKSSMRFNVRILTIACGILILSVSGWIIISAINNQVIDGGTWAGIGGFLTGLGVLITGVLYNQQSQKKTEVTQENENYEKRI